MIDFVPVSCKRGHRRLAATSVYLVGYVFTNQFIILKDMEFSVSDSQDPMDCYDRNPAKKKKASAAAQAIVI